MPKLITSRLIKVFLVFKNSPDQWLTVAQAAVKSGVHADTTKHHIRFLAKEKVLERIDETRPYCYKLSDVATGRTTQIERAAARTESNVQIPEGKPQDQENEGV